MEKTILQTYLNMPSVPAGAILNNIIRTKGLKKSDVARSASILPQRINDLITGNRRFSVDVSAALEKALGIDFPGFFYLLQTKHDIYQYHEDYKTVKAPDLSKLSITTFWDTDLKKVDWEQCEKWAIRRVLEYGNEEELQEMQRFYGKDAVSSIAKDPTGFRLYNFVQDKIKTLQL